MFIHTFWHVSRLECSATKNIKTNSTIFMEGLLVYGDRDSPFEELLNKNQFSIVHHRNVLYWHMKCFKIKKWFNPWNYEDISKLHELTYKPHFAANICIWDNFRETYHGQLSIILLIPKLRDLLSENINTWLLLKTYKDPNKH